jgi:hypothetical protein
MTDVTPEPANDDSGQPAQSSGGQIPPDQTDPSVNDVLAQQMGTEYDQVEPQDKQHLQKELEGQGTTEADEASAEMPSADEGVDDRNTIDGQVIGG